jgi:hypothetical protein
MRRWRPLARRGGAGLALAYLWRPLWLAAMLPAGVRGWAATALPRERRARLPAVAAGAWWVLWAWLRCSWQLRRRGLRAVAIHAPPRDRPGTQSGVRRAPARLPASCLVRALVRQRWHSAHGRGHDIVIAARGPLAGFAAHAWLDGDPVAGDELHELRRSAATRP